MHEGPDAVTVTVGYGAPRVARLRVADHLVSLDDGASLPTSYRNPELRLRHGGRLEIHSSLDGRQAVTVLTDSEQAHLHRPGTRVFRSPDGVSGSISLTSIVTSFVGLRARRLRAARYDAAVRLCELAQEHGALIR